MGFRNIDMNMESDSIQFSHWKSHTYDWNLEPKCLSSSSLSSRTPKGTAFFQNNNGDCESYTTSLGGQNESNVFPRELGVIFYGDQSKQMFTEYDGFEQDYSLLINSFTIEMRVGSKYAPI
jgi:hypothetical protein